MEKHVFLFPGQGSQHVGMGEDLHRNFPRVRELFEEASDALSMNFEQLCFEGPESLLVQTENVQPAITLVNVSCLEVLKSKGITPAAAAGAQSGGIFGPLRGGSRGLPRSHEAGQESRDLHEGCRERESRRHDRRHGDRNRKRRKGLQDGGRHRFRRNRQPQFPWTDHSFRRNGSSGKSHGAGKGRGSQTRCSVESQRPLAQPVHAGGPGTDGRPP